MTDLLERPVEVEPFLPHTICSWHTHTPHVHTLRCWWNVGLGGWVCPPSGTGRT